MALPETKEGLEAAGWLFDNEGRCKGCNADIEWWISPAGKKSPMSVVEVKDTTKPFPQPVLKIIRVSHFSNCPEAQKFRRR